MTATALRMDTPTFTARTLEVAGHPIPLSEAGQGPAVLALVPGRTPGALVARLAAHHRVVLADPADAAALAPALADLLGPDAGLLAQGPHAAAAMALALAAPSAVGALVLLAPTFFDALGQPADPALAARLAELVTPTLVAIGTRDALVPPERGMVWRRALPKGHVMMVYDAAADLLDERPEAVVAVTGDFLARRDKFLVRVQSGMIHP